MEHQCISDNIKPHHSHHYFPVFLYLFFGHAATIYRFLRKHPNFIISCWSKSEPGYFEDHPMVILFSHRPSMKDNRSYNFALFLTRAECSVVLNVSLPLILLGPVRAIVCLLSLLKRESPRLCCCL